MSNELKGPRFERPVERRSFLGLAAWTSFFGTLTAAVLGALRLPIPTVFPEQGSRFPIGPPQDFPAGSRVHLKARRLWVISDEAGIAAVSTVCPHLGCLVSDVEGGGFLCPCHGSVFEASGEVIGGPSPRGLLWFEVSLGPDGRLIVDGQREVGSSVRFQA